MALLMLVQGGSEGALVLLMFVQAGSEGQPVGPEDMAASIQALARSVHADSAMVFGELPKSRTRTTSRTLSTQSSISDATHLVAAQYDVPALD